MSTVSVWAINKMRVSISLACRQFTRDAPRAAAGPSHGHEWSINVAFKASLQKLGLASGEGYIVLCGVKAF